jgi:hypothetical protein
MCSGKIPTNPHMQKMMRASALLGFRGVDGLPTTRKISEQYARAGLRNPDPPRPDEYFLPYADCTAFFRIGTTLALCCAGVVANFAQASISLRRFSNRSPRR